MKKIISLGLLVLGISAVSIAQEVPSKDTKRKIENRGRKYNGIRKESKKSAEEIAKLRTDRMSESLKLTDKQKQEVYSIQLKSAQSKKKMFDERAKNNKLHQEQMKANREELNGILTPEQKQMLTESKSKRSRKDMRRLHHEGKVRGDRHNKGSHLKKSEVTNEVSINS